jgi:hypothetical protein
VWFELGYAISSQKDVVMVCSDERKSNFPFDIQHRSVIKYSTESVSDYETLKEQIKSKLLASIKRREALGEVGRLPSVAKLEGLEQHEIATLVAVAQQTDDPETGASAYSVQQDILSAGFNKLAAALGLRALLDKGMITSNEVVNYRGDEYRAYAVTKLGMDWLLHNLGNLTLRVEPRESPPAAEDDDSLPF